MKKIFTVCVILSILLLVAGCGGSKKETVNDSDTVPDEDSETTDEDSDDMSVENDEALDDDAVQEEYKIDDFVVAQECLGKKLLVNETVSVEEYDYREYSYEYYIDRWYDENCRIKFESKYYIDPDVKVNRQQNRSYKYDEKGNVMEICQLISGEYIGECQKFSYEFNDDGTIRKMCVGKMEEGREAGCVSYLYDKNGRIKQRIRRSAVTETFPFFRDFSDEDAEYLSEDYAVVESVKIKGKTVSEGIDMQERVDYFY